MVPFGEGNLCFHSCPNIIYHTTQIAIRHIGTDHNLALYILAVNRVRSGCRTDLGHVAQRNLLSRSSIDHQVGNRIHCLPIPIISLHGDIEVLAVIIDLAHDLAL